MPDSTYVQTAFSGGQWSQHAQGRYHDPKYRTALNVCQNIIPLETENAVRRPGTALAGVTRAGNKGRVIRFDFEEETPPYTMEFTDGWLRFWSGNQLVCWNDQTPILSISAASPAEITLAATTTTLAATGDEAFVTAIPGNPLLENRLLSLTRIDNTHFTLTDAVTGANINGALLSPIASGATFNHVQSYPTPYTAGQWATLRSVQSDADGTPVAFLLHANYPPYALAVASEPGGPAGAFGTFDFATATFEDGPYLDPPTNGAQLTANQSTGIVQLTLSYPAYVSTTSYAAGDIVTSASVNYVSLVDQNIGNTPASSPSKWAQTSGSAAVNNGQGFLQTDIGRLIRLFSEPAQWAIGSTYSAGAVVSYNPSGNQGQTTYWSSLAGSNLGITPGTDTTHWQLLQQGGDNSPALWTWGKITSLLNFIPGAPTGIVHIGNMTSNGGLAAAFNGNTDQNAASSANVGVAAGFGNTIALTAFVGQNFTGCATTSYKIASATIFPSTDEALLAIGFNLTSYHVPEALTATFSLTAYLFAKNSAPANATDGTVIGQVTLYSNTQFQVPTELATDTFWGGSPTTIYSTDQTTNYAYVWVALVANVSLNNTWTAATLAAQVSQVEFLAAPGSSITTNGVNVELLGPALLYETTIRTWRLGAYSNTTGWPTCGTWTDGRLWLSGVVPNRIDGCVANGITVDSAGTTVNFAPTDQYGNVLDSSAIDITVNLPEANPFLWMMPNEQGIACGTKAREALVFPPTAGGFSPTNVDARMLTRIGSANIEPVQCEHTFVFPQRYLRKIVEYFADVFSGKFTAPNLIQNAKNLTIGGIQELAYQQELVPVVWMRVNNTLVGCTYKRDTLMTSSGPTMNGWHAHTLGSGRQVESICTGSSLIGTLDALTMVTNDLSSGVRFVEVLTDILDEGSLPSAAKYLDAAIVPTSTSAVAVSTKFPYGGLQLNGLWPLNGKTVTAWLGGLDCGDYTVTNGMIQVPYGDGIGNAQGSFPAGAVNRNDQGLFTATFVTGGITANGITLFTGAMPMLVGFTFTSQGQLLRAFQPQETGARNGPAFAKLARVHYLMAQFEGVTAGPGGVLLGYDLGTNPLNPLMPALFKARDGVTDLTVDRQFSGVFRDQFQGDYTFDSRPAWQVNRPTICNVQIIGAARETADV